MYQVNGKVEEKEVKALLTDSYFLSMLNHDLFLEENRGTYFALSFLKPTVSFSLTPDLSKPLKVERKLNLNSVRNDSNLCLIVALEEGFLVSGQYTEFVDAIVLGGGALRLAVPNGDQTRRLRLEHDLANCITHELCDAPPRPRSGLA